jgi:hypothetical protein
MSDIVERLRAWSPLIASGLEVPAASLAAEEAAAEIERLRARVEVLEKALGHYAKDYLMGYCARAALEAKP